MDILQVKEPIFLRNLLLYPIETTTLPTTRNDNGLFTTIEEVLSDHCANIRECDTPDINNIVLDNNGKNPVMMIDGEEITGALQNRIISRSEIIEAHSSKQIPVVCAEEGRWNEIGGFQTGYCSYPQLRAVLSKSRNQKEDYQESIWKEITRKLTATRTHSTTSSMHDIFEHLQDEVERYVEGFHHLNHNTVGMLAAVTNRILGCDVFCSASLFRKFEKKLVRSYALDAIEFQTLRGQPADAPAFLARINEHLTTSRRPRLHMKIKHNGVTGQALFHHNSLVHLSAFPA